MLFGEATVLFITDIPHAIRILIRLISVALVLAIIKSIHHAVAIIIFSGIS
jgi:hypothetical protein